MDYRSVVAVGLSLAVVGAVVANNAACSSSSTATTAPATNDSGIVTSDVCKNAGTYDACFQCCDPPYAYFSARQAFYQCSCNGQCGAQCSTSVCTADSGVDESSDCSACLESAANVKACSSAADNVCNADADCSRFSACISALCNNLPSGDAGH